MLLLKNFEMRSDQRVYSRVKKYKQKLKSKFSIECLNFTNWIHLFKSRKKENAKKCISNFIQKISRRDSIIELNNLFFSLKVILVKAGYSLKSKDLFSLYNNINSMFKYTGLLLILIVSASSLSLNHLADFPQGRVNLKADTGKYLARCNGCGSAAYRDSAGVHGTNPADSWAIWTVESVGGGKVAFKSDIGKYLARCNNCWYYGSYPDAAFVHSDSSANPWAQWTPEDLGNGKWALKADNGKYLARCNNCVSGGAKPDMAFVHVNSPSGNPWAQWTVTSQ